MCRKCHIRFDNACDPEMAERRTRNASDPVFQKAGGEAYAAKLASDPITQEQHAKFRQAGTEAAAKSERRQRCTECGLVTRPGPLSSHQRWANHGGRVDL